MTELWTELQSRLIKTHSNNFFLAEIQFSCTKRNVYLGRTFPWGLFHDARDNLWATPVPNNPGVVDANK